ncbi:hypothetical protein FKM82_006002 [Ascaphus truei]
MDGSCNTSITYNSRRVSESPLLPDQVVSGVYFTSLGPAEWRTPAIIPGFTPISRGVQSVESPPPPLQTLMMPLPSSHP